MDVSCFSRENRGRHLRRQASRQTPEGGGFPHQLFTFGDVAIPETMDGSTMKDDGKTVDELTEAINFQGSSNKNLRSRLRCPVPRGGI